MNKNHCERGRQMNHVKVNENASVYLRIRSPITAPYEIMDNVLKVNSIVDQSSKQYTFTGIFPSEIMQQDVYNTCVENSITKEENLTVLTYGASCSGKTYTLIGDVKQAGVIPRAIKQLFSSVQNPFFMVQSLMYNFLFASTKKTFQCTKSHLNCTILTRIVQKELNHETVYDLLELPSMYVNGKRKSLKVMSNGGKTFILDLTSVFVTNSNEASILLNKGIKNRQSGPTNVNDESSRSHCIMIIDVIKHEQHQGVVTHLSYKFCDLAGSERLKKTEAEGVRRKEAQHIQTSLLVLGRCLNTVYNNQLNKTNEKIPIRDSKLTLFLQACLTGEEKLSMIVSMLPTPEFREENENVLKYASMAQTIVLQKPIKNVARRSTFSNFLAQTSNRRTAPLNEMENVEYSQVLIILDENNRLKEKTLLLEAELNEREEILLLKNDEIQKLTDKTLMLQTERDKENVEYIRLKENIAVLEAEVNDNPIYVDDPNLYKAKEILKSRIRNGRKEYLINWEPSYVQRKEITKDLIKAFERLEKAGPASEGI